MSRKKPYEYIGKRVPRFDSVQQLTGTCRYCDDYSVPDMLIAKPLFSAYAHAKILSIDTSEAERMPGIAAVLTGKDVPENRWGTGPIQDNHVLADDVVRFRGDCIAVVAAETRAEAEAAVRAIRVEYEPLPAVMTVEEALAPNAPLVHPEIKDTNVAHEMHSRIGDAEEALKGADRIVEETYTTQKVDHTPIEPRVALAIPTNDGGVHVITSCARVFRFASIMRKILKMPMSKLRVSLPEAIGGSFGGKNDLLPEPWIALLAMKTKRPVKITFTREDDMGSSTIRHPYKITHRTGVMNDGRIVGNVATMVSDKGAYYALGVAQLKKALVHCCCCYAIPNQKADGILVYTNTLPGSAMRGMGIPQSNFAWESHMDRIAEVLGMDPIELRRKNMFGEEGVLINGQTVDSRAARESFEKALSLYKNSKPVPPVPGKRRGVGLAAMIYPIGSSSPSGATAFEVKIDEDGSAVLYNGLSDVGQGSRTALSQIAAETLGIPVEKINFVKADTRMTPYDEGTGASRTMLFCGRCCYDACKKARDQILEVAGRMLNIPEPSKLDIRDGMVYAKTYDKVRVSVADVANAAIFKYCRPIIATSVYASTSTPLDGDGHGLIYENHTFGTQIAEVDVDECTGEVELLKLVAVHSCGTAINPMLVEGQINGGVHMGIGQALMEQMHEKSDGTVVSNNFSEYHLATASDMPKQMITGIVECEVDNGAYGAGGLSEGAPSPTPAAINNAVSAAIGCRLRDLPLTPESVLMAMTSGKTR